MYGKSCIPKSCTMWLLAAMTMASQSGGVLQKRLAGNREARDGNLEQAIALFSEVQSCLDI